MKTIEINLDGKDFVIGRLDAKKAAFISMTIITPFLMSIETAVKSAGKEASGLCDMLMSLDEAKFDSIINSLFPLIRIREKNVLCNIFSEGMFTHQDIADDSYIFMSLLKASVEFSFGDFFDSAARIFPAVAVMWGSLKEMGKVMSDSLASVKI